MPRQPASEAINRTDSSAVAMRAVAATLQDAFIDVWEVGTWQQRALNLITKVGRRATNAAIERYVAADAIDPALARRITTKTLASWATSLYRDVDGPLDAVIIGSPNGGVTHLATAMGVPFLSQHFLISFQDPTPVDDVAAYQAHGEEMALRIHRRNRELAVINHYDPLHDRFLVKHVNHLRLKLLSMPKHYESFIYRLLPPGGHILFTDCRYAWPMYFVDEQQWFQIGGLGGVPPRDFITGRHPEIAALQAAAGCAAPPGNWGLPGRAAFEMPESEWGAMPPFHSRTRLFARENAYDFTAIEGPHPAYFSRLAFRVWRRLFEAAGVEPQGILLETFTQVAPLAARRAGLLPLWLPWNCTDSLAFLREMRAEFETIPSLREKPILWLPLPNFTETFDMAPWEAWLDALEGFNVCPLGMQKRRYPADARALYATRQAVIDWVAAHPAPLPIEATVPVETVLEEMRTLRIERH